FSMFGPLPGYDVGLTTLERVAGFHPQLKHGYSVSWAVSRAIGRFCRSMGTRNPRVPSTELPLERLRSGVKESPDRLYSPALPVRSELKLRRPDDHACAIVRRIDAKLADVIAHRH